jgi:uncharacterized protein (UPF0548 family)
MDGSRLDRLRDEQLTYDCVGAALAGAAVPGYHRRVRSRVLGAGRSRFADAVDVLHRWEMHRRAGVAVDAAADRAAVGVVADLRIGVRAVAVHAPVRVVSTVAEPDRQGFAYGTLPGHPFSGEEAFVVQLLPDGAVRGTITSVSRPATLLVRVAPPVSRLAQQVALGRYLAALA